MTGTHACACGDKAVDECGACRAKRLQRQPAAVASRTNVPTQTGAATRFESGGSALPAPLRGAMESRFGSDFSNVRVHDDAAGHAHADRYAARAFTVGQHIHFAAGEFARDRTSGSRLLAHELAHTIQQGGSDAESTGERIAVDAPHSPREQEADAAAEAVGAGKSYRVQPGTTPEHLLSRQPANPPTPVPPVAPTTAQARIIETVRQAAAVRTQVAMFRTRGTAPDERTAEAYRQEARRLASLMFEWSNPNMQQVDEIVSSMVTHLTGSPSIMVAGRGDPECGSRAGYVRGLRPPVVLCPTFFSDTPEQQIRTLIHEAAHLARIGNAGTAEGYCTFFTCDTACPGGFDSADSWAQYVHCLSGRPPDRPPPITPSGGGRGGGSGGSGTKGSGS